jgi:hypothetical protein|nr:translocation/assembly module TamB domain-containing protein [Kofleriaceae bacterium]
MRPARRARLVWRVVGWTCATVFAVVVTAVAAAAVLLYTTWGRAQVRDQVEAQLADVFVGGVTIGDVEATPTGDVVARDVVVHDADGLPAITIGAIAGRIELDDLLHDELRLQRVVANDVTVVARHRDDGEWNLAELTKKGPESAWTIWLPRVEMRSTQVIVEGQHVDNAIVDAVVDVPRSGVAFASVALDGAWRERGNAPVDLALTVNREAVGADDSDIRVPLLVGRVGDVGLMIALGELADGKGRAIAAASGTRAAWQRLGVDVPVDVAAAVDIQPRGDRELAKLVGVIDRSPVRATASVDVARRLATGQATFAGVDAADLRRGVTGRLAGTVAFDADASGKHPVVAVTAHVTGRDVRYDGARVASLAVDVDATGLPARPRGHAKLELTGVERGDLRLASVSVTAANHDGDTIDVAVRTRPQDRPWLFEADARVHVGDPATDIDLTSHHVRIAGSDWRGTTGHVTVTRAGAVSVRGFATRSDHGSLAVDGSFARGRLKLAATADVTGVGHARADLDIAGRDVRRADVDVDADLGKLAALLGVQQTIVGKLTVKGSAAHDAITASIDAHVAAVAGALAHPVDVHGDVALGGDGLHVDARLEASRGARRSAASPAESRVPDDAVVAPLATLHVDVKRSLAQLVAAPAQLLAAPVDGTLEVPTTQARELLGIVGRSDVIAGTVDGAVHVTGTAARWSATGKLAAHDLEVPLIGRAGHAVAREVTLDATANPATAHATLVASAADGGTLKLEATTELAHPIATQLALTASRFELHTLTAALPGAAGAITGRLDGTLTASGLDPRTAKLAGNLKIVDGRIPIAPNLGTLRDATISIQIAQSTATIAADGKLRRGTVRLRGTLPLAGDSGHATIELRQISPIAAIEPAIDADVTADLRRTADRLDVALKIEHGVIRVPDDRDGHPLDAIGLPDDYTLEPAPNAPPPQAPRGKDVKAKAPPPNPTLVCTIDLGATRIESKELRGEISGKVTLSIGASQNGSGRLGVVGNITAKRGDLELFGRRYQLDHATAQFDGTTDPTMDARIVYDFADVTTITELRGRLSKPELQMRSDPPNYTQDELLGFLLGGEPNGDPTQSQSQSSRVAGVGTSLVAQKLSGTFKKALPISIDVFDYESATASNSAALRVGTWLTRDLFLAYRRHLDVRPDENASEGEVEYWVTPKVSLTGTAGDRDYDGVDLLWRHRW